ncbi:MAG: hypothetical protein H8D23_10050 [Candidatus Brocadiales bacterium]|nr:hypothetical protein [Candidatus Brocadiales bacterium]
MKRYKDDLVPREIKKGFYRNIELGKDVVLQRIDISNQLREMIVSHVGLACSTDTNRGSISAGINLITYDNRDIGNGIYGLKAAFEWNISEVVWQIEQNVKGFKALLKILYNSLDPSFAKMRFLAQEAYEKGKIADAADNFRKLSQSCESDFSVFLSLGIISLFHEKNKEKALEYFNKAVEIAKSQSDIYTSYALIYKALVLRNLDRLEEAVKFSKEAVDLSPDFTEALYQYAQYSALLKKTETVVPLLKKLISIDILYCLKISNEKDFNGIKSHVTKIIKETIAPLHEGIKNKLNKLDEKMHCLNVVIDSIQKQGLDISDNHNLKQLKEDKQEFENKVDCNSALNIFVVDRCLSQLDKNLQHDKSQLLSDCKDLQEKVKSERKKAAMKLKKIKGKNLLSPFFLYLFLSQVYAIPVGIFVQVPPDLSVSRYTMLIEASIGIPPGVLILEAIAVVSCALIVFVPTIGPRLKCERIYTHLQHKVNKLDDTIKAIECA